jgi:hypothetical protein
LTTRAQLVASIALAVAVHGLGTLALGSRPIARLLMRTGEYAFGGALAPRYVVADVRTYFDYASSAIDGRVPYRDFPVEYPLGAVPVFLLPRLVAGSFGAYRVAFALEMLLADAVAVALVAWRVERREGMARVPGRLAWYSLFLLALGPLPVARFDLVPTALAFATALAWASGRAALGGVAAGVGLLVKLFPAAVLAPVLVPAVQDAARRRGLRAFGLTVAVGAVAWLGLGGAQVRSSLDYQLGRGLEIEAVAAGLLIVAARLGGADLAREFNHSSEELLAPGAAWAASLALPLQGLALLVVAARSRTAGRDDGLRSAAAAVLGLMVAGKVLSPQYLIWPIPFIAALEGRTGRWARPAFLACCLATSAVFPWAWMGLIQFDPRAVGLLNARNALLLMLWGLLLFGPAEVRSEAA